MPSTDEIKNELKNEIMKTLSDPTPLYALAGAGDLAYEKLREMPGRVEALAVDRKGAQDMAVAGLQEAQTKLLKAQAQAQAAVAGTVTALPTDFKALQEKAQTFALQQVGRAAELAVKAKEVYDELAERGKVVVEKGRTAQSEGASAGVEQQADAEVVEVEVLDVEVVEIDDASAGEADQGKPASAKKAARARKTPTQK
ncbi:hypothetical protein GCM10009665_12390 [Kitasatospora nipponensis]|uniref:Heparin binding hemagglutinin HbhA n=1 Tax=Kitasatospora nipponensis TaxID=258049 RepID=A0ABN1VXE6_9ACTN